MLVVKRWGIRGTNFGSRHVMGRGAGVMTGEGPGEVFGSGAMVKRGRVAGGGAGIEQE